MRLCVCVCAYKIQHATRIVHDILFRLLPQLIHANESDWNVFYLDFLHKYCLWISSSLVYDVRVCVPNLIFSVFAATAAHIRILYCFDWFQSTFDCWWKMGYVSRHIFSSANKCLAFQWEYEQINCWRFERASGTKCETNIVCHLGCPEPDVAVRYYMWRNLCAVNTILLSIL